MENSSIPFHWEDKPGHPKHLSGDLNHKFRVKPTYDDEPVVDPYHACHLRKNQNSLKPSLPLSRSESLSSKKCVTSRNKNRVKPSPGAPLSRSESLFSRKGATAKGNKNGLKPLPPISRSESLCSCRKGAMKRVWTGLRSQSSNLDVDPFQAALDMARREDDHHHHHHHGLKGKIKKILTFPRRLILKGKGKKQH